MHDDRRHHATAGRALKRGGGDFTKDLAEEVLARPMAYDVEGQIGAGRYERNEERTTQRNGYRHRAFDTRLCTLDLKIPKLIPFAGSGQAVS